MATCQVDSCGTKISRGSATSKAGSLGNGGMITHLRTKHPEVFKDMNTSKTAKKGDERDDKDETVRGSKCSFRLRTKQSRQDFLEQVKHIKLL